MVKEKKNSIPARMDPKFLKEVQDMQLKRIMKGKDKPLKPARTSRITLAVSRHKLFPEIKKDIIEADLKDD